MRFSLRLAMAFFLVIHGVVLPCLAVETLQIPTDQILRVEDYAQMQKLPGVSAQPRRIIPVYWRKFPTGPQNTLTDVPGVQVGDGHAFI
jgi:hypothetical protein